MKFFVACLFCFSNFFLIAQHSTPELAEIIEPSGYSIHELRKGLGIEAVSNVNSDSLFKLHSGFSCWMKFSVKGENNLTFTIKSLDNQIDQFGFPLACGISFAIYEFEGNGKELSTAIQKNAIKPVRMLKSDGFLLDRHNESGLSFFENDSIATDRYHSRFFKPLQSPNATQFYLVVQILYWGANSTLTIDNRFSICFNSSCVFPSLTIRNLNFDSGKSDLKEDNPLLNQVAIAMISDSSIYLKIQGYTDNSGDQEENIKLSNARAIAVYNYLIKEGVSKSRLSYQGFGSSHPLVPNTSEENKFANRRVELSFTKKP